MNKYYFKDINKILFSYDMSNNKICSIFENEINIDEEKNNKYILNIFGENNWHINYMFQDINIPIVLAKYFAGNYIYEGTVFVDNIKDKKYKNLTYNVFKKQEVEKYLLEKGYSPELIKCLIGFHKGNLPTDIFCNNYMQNISVTASNNQIIKVEFQIGEYRFIDDHKRFYDDIEKYVRYRFWGNANLNGQPIKLKKELA